MKWFILRLPSTNVLLATLMVLVTVAVLGTGVVIGLMGCEAHAILTTIDGLLETTEALPEHAEDMKAAQDSLDAECVAAGRTVC